MKNPVDFTPELRKHLLKEALPFTDENIKWQFVGSPRWEELFNKTYPKFSTKDYLEKSLDLLFSIGLKMKLGRLSENKKSDYYKAFNAELYIKDEWECELCHLHEANVLNSWVLEAMDHLKKVL